MILHEEQLKSSMIDQQAVPGVHHEKHSLYLRFPKKLNADRTLAESEVKSFNSKIIRVRIPRQRSANFCLVDFASQDDKEKALKELKKVEINDKRLVVKEAVRNDKVRVQKKIEKIKVKREVNESLGKLFGDIKNSLDRKYGQHNLTNGLVVKDLKAGTTQTDVRQMFPHAIDIKLIMKTQRKNSFALVWLPTPKDAREAASETVTINGDEYVVNLQNDGKQKKRKRNNESNDHGDDSSEEDGSGSEDEGSGSEGADIGLEEEGDGSEESDVDSEDVGESD